MAFRESDFDKAIRAKYEKQKGLKTFTNLILQAYDGEEIKLYRLLCGDSGDIEDILLSDPTNEDDIQDCIDKYGIDPEPLIRLTSELANTILEPLDEGYYHKILPFEPLKKGAKRKKKGKKKNQKKGNKKTASKGSSNSNNNSNSKGNNKNSKTRGNKLGGGGILGDRPDATQNRLMMIVPSKIELTPPPASPDEAPDTNEDEPDDNDNNNDNDGPSSNNNTHNDDEEYDTDDNYHSSEEDDNNDDDDDNNEDDDDGDGNSLKVKKKKKHKGHRRAVTNQPRKNEKSKTKRKRKGTQEAPVAISQTAKKDDSSSSHPKQISNRRMRAQTMGTLSQTEKKYVAGSIRSERQKLKINKKFFKNQKNSSLALMSIQKEQKKEEAATHPFQTMRDLFEWREAYHYKFMDQPSNQRQKPLSLPVIWQCMFYHVGNEPFQFEELEEESNEQTAINALNDLWANDELLCTIPDYDSEGSDNDNDDDGNTTDNEQKEQTDAKLTEIPEFVHNFSYSKYFDTFKNEKTGAVEKMYVYRIRRWMNTDTKDGSRAKRKYEDRKYTWLADKTKTNKDYILSDDLILLQNRSCTDTDKPSWFVWLDRDKTGIKYIRDSGFFSKHTGLQLFNHKGNILNGVCCVGAGTRNEFVFGKHETIGNEEGEIYGIIRLDTLAHALCHFACHSAPLANVGQTLNQYLMLSPSQSSDELKVSEVDDSDVLVPKVSFGGLWFNNMKRYILQRGNSMACKIDIDRIIKSKIEIEELDELEDIWTIALCFCHPIPSADEATLLYKKDSFEIYIESNYSEKFGVKTFNYEELVIKLYNNSNANEIFRRKIRRKYSEWTYMHGNDSISGYGGDPLVDGNVHVLTLSMTEEEELLCWFDGRDCTNSDINEKGIGNTKVLDTSKTKYMCMGYKGTQGDSGLPVNLFNGHIFEFAVFPTHFNEFEMRAFYTQCQLHIQIYTKLMDKSGVLYQNLELL